MCTHAEQRHQHQRQVIADKAERADGHDDDLGQLDGPYQRVLGELLAKLPAQRREQEERQDEQQRTQVDPNRAVAVAQAEFEQDGQDQRLLEQVVVEGTQRLGDEKRQEAPLAEQGELRVTHRPCSWRGFVIGGTQGAISHKSAQESPGLASDA